MKPSPSGYTETGERVSSEPSTFFVVPGKPVAQGSMVAYGRKVAASNASELGLFRDRVAIAAAREWGEENVDKDSGFRVLLTFIFERPKGHYGKKGLRPSAPTFHVKRPDVDKLARAALDSLTHIVFADDSQVVRLHARKEYADDGRGSRLEVSIKRLA